MSFAWSWAFLLLPLPWLVRRWSAPLAAGAALRVPARADFISAATDSASSRTDDSSRPGAELRIAAIVWLLLVVAAARPQALDDPTPLPVSGRDLMIALDVSASMATADLKLDGRAVDRLHVARALAGEFVTRRDGDRVGLIVFGSEAYLHTPLTYDLPAVRTALAATAIGLAGRETALGDAIALAATRLREFGDSDKVLILLTDGANTAGQLTPSQAGWIAARDGLRVHAVGFGAERLHTVEYDGTDEADSMRELDEDGLRALARQTGGSYHRAADPAALAAFLKLIDEIEPVAQGDVPLRPVRELHPWPLGAALGLVAWLALRRARKTIA